MAINTLGAPDGGEKDGKRTGRGQADESADIGGDMGEQQRGLAGIDGQQAAKDGTHRQAQGGKYIGAHHGAEALIFGTAPLLEERCRMPEHHQGNERGAHLGDDPVLGPELHEDLAD